MGRSVAESEELEEQLGIIGWGILPQTFGDSYPVFFDIRFHWVVLLALIFIPFVWLRLIYRKNMDEIKTRD